ncbi:MAG: AroM family protein, partial [Gammaproteobacteria bacterium]|nr:AroM family protein [Gammaproteobacteria bacterium]
AASLPPVTKMNYPLSTRLRDGSLVLVEESFLTPRLQHTLDALETNGVTATLLLCAGTFSSLQGTRLLYKPFTVGRALLHTLGMKS